MCPSGAGGAIRSNDVHDDHTTTHHHRDHNNNHDRYEVKVFTDTNEECQQWMLIMQDAIFYRKLIAGDEESLKKFERQTSSVADSDLGTWLAAEVGVWWVGIIHL